MSKGFIKKFGVKALGDIKSQNYSAVGSHSLHEKLSYLKPGEKSHTEILSELKKRGHAPGSKWAKEYL